MQHIDTKNLFILSGPSGAGEDSIIEGLRKFLPIERVVTSTTRAPRAGESEGNPYYFLSREQFEKGIQNDEFVEYAQEYNDNFYGVTKTEIERVASSGRIGIWKIEWKGVITAKKLYPDIVAIFLMTENMETLERRIRRRDGGVSDAYVAERMAYTKEWLKHTDIYDYTIINKEGRLDEAVRQAQNIIQATRNQQS